LVARNALDVVVRVRAVNLEFWKDKMFSKEELMKQLIYDLRFVFWLIFIAGGLTFLGLYKLITYLF
jgi:hypothetical protein